MTNNGYQWAAYSPGPLDQPQPRPPQQGPLFGEISLDLSLGTRTSVPNMSLTMGAAPGELVPNHFLTLKPAEGEGFQSLPIGIPLMKLYEASPKIMKKLTPTDVGTNHSLILSKEVVENTLLPSLGNDVLAEQIKSSRIGVRFRVLDPDDSSLKIHYLVLKKHASYVLMGNWKLNFVQRKNLEQGDVIGISFAHGYLIFKLLCKHN